ncbi:DUF922 domain-containing protein [Mesorhizobium sp. M7A.F.Ca.US.008.03.1.1]|uniref:DUF922 domain-containing protein n=1 Tax=Mesorhizobium sp. M7A.F.Ca.US.008.03.1.1 TaxID=2496742 RepID=UPI0013DF73AA|nr:DUF922 domain-containing protein [Mesorhizobium sp. M7A.F.Ca.US.008.03.1.1]
MKQIILTALLFLIATLPANADVKVEESSTYFNLQGLTSREIHQDLMRNAPREGGEIIEGEVADHFSVDFQSRMDGQECRAFDERVTLKLKIQLPKWVDEKRAASAVRVSWNQYMDKLLAHENRHKEIAISAAHAVHDIIHTASIKGSCEGLDAKIRRAAKRTISESERRQQAWDENAEQFGIE